MKSTIQKQVDAVWTVIEKAVTAGLKEDPKQGKPELSDLVAVVTRSAALADHLRYSWSTGTRPTQPAERAPISASRLDVTAGAVHELRSSLPVELEEPDTDDVERWAKRVRRDERRWVVEQLAATATLIGRLDASGLEAAAKRFPGGRLVALAPNPRLEEACKEVGVDHVDVGVPVATDRAAILFATDELAVSRLEPFSLGWGVVDGGPRLELVERVKLIGFGHEPRPLPEARVVAYTSIDLPSHPG